MGEMGDGVIIQKTKYGGQERRPCSEKIKCLD